MEQHAGSPFLFLFAAKNERGGGDGGGRRAARETRGVNAAIGEHGVERNES